MFRRLSAPMTVFLNVTNRCNLHCVYCSSNAGHRDSYEMPSADMYRIVCQLIQAKVFHVILTGGEPFVRADLGDILEELVSNKIRVTILTNGTEISPDHAALLSRLSVDDVCISVDSSIVETNDATRGRGSFERALRGIRTLGRCNVKPRLSVTVTAANHTEIELMVKDFLHWDVKGVSFSYLSGQGRGGNVQKTLGLSWEQLKRCEGALRTIQSENPGFACGDVCRWLALPAQLINPHNCADGSPEPGARLLPCGAGKTQCAITADGWMVPCNRFSDYRCGNLLTESFVDVWNSPAMMCISSLANELTSSTLCCQACRYNSVCAGGCRAEAYQHFRDLRGPDPGCAILPDSAVHGFSGKLAG